MKSDLCPVIKKKKWKEGRNRGRKEGREERTKEGKKEERHLYKPNTITQ